MRRRPGIAGIQRDAATREQFKSAGEEVRRSALAQMKEQLALFQAKLQAFAREHKADIRRDPLFRAQFQAMCANIGVDPLASNKVCVCVYGVCVCVGGLGWLVGASSAQALVALLCPNSPPSPTQLEARQLFEHWSKLVPPAFSASAH
jgi:hypothetical protein